MDHKEGKYKVADLSLAPEGRMRIEWAESRMPVLMKLREEYSQSKPFAGYKITGCLHVTKDTAKGRAVSILEGGYSVTPPPPKRKSRPKKGAAAPPDPEPDLTGGLVDGATAHLKALADFRP